MRILFVCTGNACRSQMAEGFARALLGSAVTAFSAGLTPKGLDPRAVTVMAEAGVDISGQHSKALAELPNVPFDVVVTLCGAAGESCPYVPGAGRRIHAGFDDPPVLAARAASEEEAREPYRRVRDAIRDFVLGLPERLAAVQPGGTDQDGEHPQRA